ncbi:MAG: glycosyl hydrolase [Bacteroidota bacterium]
MNPSIPTSLRVFLFICMFSFSDLSAQVDESIYADMKYRFAGPYRGGRVTAVTGIPDQKHTFFMGTTGGGVWRTDDGGGSWQNISDKYIKCGSIGSVEVAPSDPQIMYVGTGSASARGNISAGIGMFRSEDGGESWRSIGLEDAGQIGKIQVHPKNPDLVYVAVLGNIFGKNEMRGVYRSKDGGAFWEQVLFHSDSVGAIDLVMDPNNPRILYAGMWRAERKPWTMIDGSKEGGLYKSIDGGDNWIKLKGGLPEGVGGRVGVAVSPVNSKRVWMIREMKEESKGGIYRSDNGGRSWTKINREHKLRQRAWYYSRIFADPKDENTVYVLNTGMYKSIDGGKTFSRISTPHGDNHCLWINPYDTDIMIESNDGGANVSYNGGKSWSTQYNQPTSEFYRLTVDNQYPYRLYAAQQDNSTISVPSNSPGGITPLQHWKSVGGGESGHIAVDPRNPNLIYAGNYIGRIDRTDLSKGYSRNVTHYPQMHDGQAGRDIKYRFQWNAPIRLSPHNPDKLYHCSQYVHVSMDGGKSWEVISPDLTTNIDEWQNIPGGPVQHDHTGVELYTTIFAFEESPQNEGELWAGTDDGRVHLSVDGGESWEEITPASMPLYGTVNMIDLSPHENGRAFMAVYRYRDNDFLPYIYKTDDYGESWELLTDGKNGIPETHFVRVVREDPIRKGLLYAGTEYGMYISFDEGLNWQAFQQNLPTTPITDMQIKNNDLVLATQGRAFWIMDDLSPLQQFDLSVEDKIAHLYSPRPAYRSQIRGFRGGNAPKSAPNGAIFHINLISKPGKKDTVSLIVLNKFGETLSRMSTHPKKGESKLKLKKGLNRIVYNMRGERPNLIKGSFMSLADTRGPKLPPDTYQLVLLAMGESDAQSFQIKKDPRWESTESDLKEQYDLALEVKSLLNTAHNAIRKIRSIREQSMELAVRAETAGFSSELMSDAKYMGEKLTALENKLIQTKNESGQDPINYPSQIDDQIAYLYSVVNAQDASPTLGCYERFEDLKKELQPYLDELQEIVDNELKFFTDKVEGMDLPWIVLPKE